MDNSRWVLDGGTPEQWLAEMDELLKDVTMVITEEQKELVRKYIPNVQWYIDEVEVDRLLDALKAKTDEIGYDANHKLNATGQELKKLYDELDEQN